MKICRTPYTVCASVFIINIWASICVAHHQTCHHSSEDNLRCVCQILTVAIDLYCNTVSGSFWFHYLISLEAWQTLLEYLQTDWRADPPETGFPNKWVFRRDGEMHPQARHSAFSLIHTLYWFLNADYCDYWSHTHTRTHLTHVYKNTHIHTHIHTYIHT